MNKKRFSLMTFPMEIDLWAKKLSIENLFELAEENEISYIDVMNIRKKDIKLYQSISHKTNIRIYCYIASVSFFNSKRKIQSQIRSNLETARMLGAKLLMIVPYKGKRDLKYAKKIGHDATIQKLIEGFRIAVHQGKNLDIKVCFETTPHDVICLSGSRDCKEILQKVKGLGYVFDTANSLPHGENPFENYMVLWDYIVHVHLKDVCLIDGKKISLGQEASKDGRLMQCVVWGEGIIPIQKIYNLMRETGYDGLFAIEYVHPKEIFAGKVEHDKQLKKFKI